MKKSALPMNRKTLLATSLVFLSLSAVASSTADLWRPKKCLRWEVSEIDPKIVDLGVCRLVQPELKTTYQVFNRTNESLPVDYWDGGYERILTREVRYQYDLVNHCGRHRGMIVRSYEESRMDFQRLLFGFSNPNLDRNLRYSFLKSPLTKVEVEAEIPGLYSKCLEFGVKSISARK